DDPPTPSKKNPTDAHARTPGTTTFPTPRTSSSQRREHGSGPPPPPAHPRPPPPPLHRRSPILALLLHRSTAARPFSAAATSADVCKPRCYRSKPEPPLLRTTGPAPSGHARPSRNRRASTPVCWWRSMCLEQMATNHASIHETVYCTDPTSSPPPPLQPLVG
uniref:Uncharacterized protein n=1 Tax=Aegilops tauschii subsp. strangulata TaxID=200361 RepID=A0A453JJB8_AEGTS